MAITHYDVMIKVTEVVKPDPVPKSSYASRGEVPNEQPQRIITDLLSIVIKASTKEDAIDKVVKLLITERIDDLQKKRSQG